MTKPLIYITIDAEEDLNIYSDQPEAVSIAVAETDDDAEKPIVLEYYFKPTLMPRDKIVKALDQQEKELAEWERENDPNWSDEDDDHEGVVLRSLGL